MDCVGLDVRVSSFALQIFKAVRFLDEPSVTQRYAKRQIRRNGKALSEYCGNLSEMFQPFHERLVLFNLLHVIISLQAQPDIGIGAKGRFK